MARWLWDYEQLKVLAPDKSIVTCHDEFLLPSLVEAADGALIGFAGICAGIDDPHRALRIGWRHRRREGSTAAGRTLGSIDLQLW